MSQNEIEMLLVPKFLLDRQLDSLSELLDRAENDLRSMSFDCFVETCARLNLLLYLGLVTPECYKGYSSRLFEIRFRQRALEEVLS